MRPCAVVRAGALALLANALAAPAQGAETFLPRHPAIDILIEDGAVLDGLGGEPRPADVAIANGRIVFVGDTRFSSEDLERRVARRIPADGRIVAPGFIDLHSHGDPFATPAFENFLAMGVTSVTLGQDGSSPDTAQLAEWLDNLDRAGTGPNVAMFVGHGTLRNLTGVGLDPEPTAGQVGRMLALLDESLAVTFGMSLGLEYNPGLNAPRRELEALAEVVGRHDRVVMSHMRNEDDEALEDSIAELLTLGEHTRVHISHLKSVYGRGSARADEILAILEHARAAGIRITADVYPYTASYTGIAILFPVWAKTEDQFARAKRERRDELAAWLRNRVEQRNGPEATLLGTAPWTGRTLAEVAFEHERPFEDVLIDVIGPRGASAAYFVMNDELQSRLVADAHVGIGSDGSPSAFHPRGYGSFARIIQEQVVRQGRLPLAEAVRKMTSLPARILGIADRGALQEGMRADVVIFDPENVRAVADYVSPHRYAKGFDVVIVNGEVAREDGRLTGALPGRVLYPPPVQPAVTATRE